MPRLRDKRLRAADQLRVHYEWSTYNNKNLLIKKEYRPTRLGHLPKYQEILLGKCGDGQEQEKHRQDDAIAQPLHSVATEFSLCVASTGHQNKPREISPLAGNIRTYIAALPQVNDDKSRKSRTRREKTHMRHESFG